MRILWLGNPPWLPSGYGEQAALTIPRLIRAGHHVAVLCNWGLHGRELNWNGVPCYPTDGQWGNTNLATFSDKHEADLVIALCDAWVLHPDTWPDGPPVMLWAPVDHHPCPPAVVKVLEHPRIQPLAMSRFGERMMRQAGLESGYVPHMVDTKVFRPLPEVKDAVRDELEIPRDAYVVGMVAANTGQPGWSRKSFPQAFQAFARFAKTHEDAWLYAHTQARPAQGGGMALDTLAGACGIPAGRLWFPNDEAWHDPMPTENMGYLYQAFDVLLMPSMGEGFGIPLLEAQACGVPVITSDHSAMTENRGVGWLVEGDPWWDAVQQAWFTIPHVDSITARLEAAYASRGDALLRDRAVAFAAAYDAHNAFQTYWKPLLTQDRVAA